MRSVTAVTLKKVKFPLSARQKSPDERRFSVLPLGFPLSGMRNRRVDNGTRRDAPSVGKETKKGTRTVQSRVVVMSSDRYAPPASRTFVRLPSVRALRAVPDYWAENR
jgi:hypothetical protein